MRSLYRELPLATCHFAWTKWLVGVIGTISLQYCFNAFGRVGSRMLLVTADVHERASRVPLVLAEMGVSVEVRAQPRGDYVVGPSTVVERKTVIGLHRSIQEGRFWKQMGKLREAGNSTGLLLQGRSGF